MLLVLPENMGLVIRSLCPYLPGVFPCPLPSTQSSSCVLRDICVASAWLSRFPYCLGLGLREEVLCPLSRESGSRGQSWFCGQATGERLWGTPGGDKAMAPGLGPDRTATFLSPSHFPAETEGLTDELPWTI